MNPLAKPTVLVVEDDDIVRDGLRGLLQDECDAICVSRLASARRLLTNVAFDVLLLDLVLPDGDGDELLADIVEGRVRSTRVIIVSAARRAREVAETHRASFLCKPFTSDELMAAIRAARAPRTRLSTPV